MALSTGQVAKAGGVNIQTVRFYEREGLLPPPRRSASGYRQYTEEAVRIVTFVKRAQELGFTLREAKQLVRLRGARAEACGGSEVRGGGEAPRHRREAPRLDRDARGSCVARGVVPGVRGFDYLPDPGGSRKPLAGP